MVIFYCILLQWKSLTNFLWVSSQIKRQNKFTCGNKIIITIKRHMFRWNSTKLLNSVWYSSMYLEICCHMSSPRRTSIKKKMSEIHPTSENSMKRRWFETASCMKWMTYVNPWLIVFWFFFLHGQLQINSM